MKTVQIPDFKANFFSLLKEVDKGEVIEVTSADTNEVKGYFVPAHQYEKKKIVFGLASKMGMVIEMNDNFEFTNKEIEDLFGI